MPLNLFYTMVQKSQKWPKTQIKGGGSCLKVGLLPLFFMQLLLSHVFLSFMVRIWKKKKRKKRKEKKSAWKKHSLIRQFSESRGMHALVSQVHYPL